MNEKKEQNNKDIRDALFINCPIRNVLARIGDKWSLLVLYNLQHKEPMRFKELQRQMPDISQKSLTQTLRTLKEEGFISRDIINMRMIKMCILYNISLKVGYFEINGVFLHKNIYKQNTICRYY